MNGPTGRTRTLPSPRPARALYRAVLRAGFVLAALPALALPLAAQAGAGQAGAGQAGAGRPTVAMQDAGVQRVDLPTGRSFPISAAATISKVSVATPEVADVVVISERELVINGKGTGESDVIIWLANGQRMHYRVLVHSPSDRQQIMLAVKFAEVRKDALVDIETSARYVKEGTRAGAGQFRSDNPFDSLGKIILPTAGRFLSVLSDFGTRNLLALIEAEEQRGRARTLAEPTLMAANKEEASFLAGGQLPIPVVQGGTDAGARISIEYREFGVKLHFLGEIISDSLIKLKVSPEVSNLDYNNALVISGFRVPALRTRRVESTLDVRQNESLIISGFFNEEEQKTRTGVPLLMDIPILGALFSSTNWQKNQTELVVIVTPMVVDPMHPPVQDVIRLKPDTTLPARSALEKRLEEGKKP